MKFMNVFTALRMVGALFVAGGSFPAVAALQFEVVPNPPTVGRLNAVATDGVRFVAAGTNSTVVRSLGSAGPLTWSTSSLPGSLDLRAVTHGAAGFVTAGTSNLVFSSTDGADWVLKADIFANPLITRTVGLAAQASGRHVAVSEGRNVRWADSSLATWTIGVTPNNIFDTYRAVAPLGPNGFVAVGIGGLVRISTDGGSNWPVNLPVGSGSSLHGVVAFGSTIVAVGTNGAVRFSTNSGSTWTTNKVGVNSLNAVAYTGRSGEEFIAVGNGGVIWTSSNGQAWTSVPSPTTANLLGIAYASTGPLAGTLVIVGESGTIILAGDVPLPPASGGNRVICADAAIPALTVSVPPGVTVDWYGTATGGQPLRTASASYQPPADPPGMRTFYAEARRLESGQVSAQRTAVSLTIHPLPAAPVSGVSRVICADQPIPALTVTVPGGITVDWYATAALGQPVATGVTTFTPPTKPVGTQSFYAQARNVTTGCLSGTRTAVTLTVNANPAAPVSGGNRVICADAAIPALTVTVPGGVIANWYAAASGGTLLATGSSYTPPTKPVGVQTFYAEALVNLTGCLSTTRTAVTLTVNANPAAPVSGGNKVICADAEISALTVTVPGGVIANWYAAASGGALLATGSSYTPPTKPVGVQTFYAESLDNATGCLSTTRTAVSLAVNAPPFIQQHPESAYPRTGEPVTFSVVTTGDGLSYQWLRNGFPLAGATGASLTLPAVQRKDMGLFSVRVTGGGCSVISSEAKLTVLPEGPGWFDSATATDLMAMGSRGSGRLGDGSDNQYTLPRALTNNVKAIAAGASHLLLLLNDNTLWVMGENFSGQLGVGDTEPRRQLVHVFDGVKAIAAGNAHSLFVTTDRKLWAMGDNGAGQLGVGDTNSRSTPIFIKSEVAKIAAGGSHSLIVTTAGNLEGMGLNQDGQLGLVDTVSRYSPEILFNGVTQIAAGQSHSLFVTAEGKLWAMGANWAGQLGVGDFESRTSPEGVFAGVAQVSAGSAHSLFVTTDGDLLGMGNHINGQLGLGENPNPSTGWYFERPEPIASSVAGVFSGPDESFFTKQDDTFWGMGANGRGQLGDGTTTSRFEPVLLGNGMAMAASAGGLYSLFLRSNGNLQASGASASAPFGYQDQSVYQPAFVMAEVKVVDASRAHSLFLRTNGELWSAGANESGQLGDGTTLSRPHPVMVATGVTDFAAGAYHSLFVRQDGTLWAMGRNNVGQLGNGTNESQISPVAIASNVAAVSAGYSHSLFVMTDGTLWGMGSNGDGQLGNGNNDNQPDPVLITNQVWIVAAGDFHTLFIKTNGTLWGMGGNNLGQLGDSSNVSRNRPVLIQGNVTFAAAGWQHSLFTTSDGTLWGMGADSSGQLGLELGSNPNFPFQLDSAVVGKPYSLAAGDYHSLYVKNDGSLWAMGGNSSGQLGDGTFSERRSPVKVAEGVVHVTAGWNHSFFLSAARPRFLPEVMGRTADGRSVFAIQTPPGNVELQTAPELPAANWEIMGQAGTGFGTLLFVDPMPPAPRRYFRLRQVPP